MKALNTSLVKAKEVGFETKGKTIEVRQADGSLTKEMIKNYSIIDHGVLTLDTLIEFKNPDSGAIEFATIQQLDDRYRDIGTGNNNFKIRCQVPEEVRADSRSMNGIINFRGNGEIFLTDNGTNTQYVPQGLVAKAFKDAGVVGEVVSDSTGSEVATAGGAITGELIADIEWVDGKKNKTMPKDTIDNVQQALELKGVGYGYNQMTKEPDFNIPRATLSQHNKANDEYTALKSIASELGFSREAFLENALSLANSKTYHPAVTWIESVAWDGLNRFPELVKSFDPVDLDMAEILIRRWMISHMPAIYNSNGVSAQGMLLLVGLQGCGKSRKLEALYGGQAGLFKSGVILNPSDKDSVKQAVRHWGFELAEFGATGRKSDRDEFKAFITNDKDILRPAYSRAEVHWERRSIVSATTNDYDILTDPTGNRRFWIVEVNQPKDHPLPDMQQMWAQVKTWYENGEQWHLTDAELDLVNKQNENYQAVCPIEELIKSAFDFGSDEREIAMTVSQVCNRIGIDIPTAVQVRKAGSAVRKLLGVSKAKRSHGMNLYDMPKRSFSHV